MTTIDAKELQRDCLGYLRRVADGETLRRVAAGESLLIVDGDKPIAELHPPTPRPRRPIGLAEGEFTVPDDFDAPMRITYGP